MGLKIVRITLVFSAIIVTINCDSFGNCSNRKSLENVRIKRAKYYSNLPSIFYRAPPASPPVKGYFSYTPPPNYMNHEQHHYRPTKVSRRPNEGLEDEDISNIVKYLSKKDFDKLMELAYEKERYSDQNKFVREQDERPKRPESEIFQSNSKVNYYSNDDDRIIQSYNEKPEAKIIYHGSETHNGHLNYVTEPTQPRILNNIAESHYKYPESDSNINYAAEPTQDKIIYSRPTKSPNNYFQSQNTFTVPSNFPINEAQGNLINPFSNTQNTVTNPNSYNGNNDFTHSGLDIDEMKQYFNIVEKFNEMEKGTLYTDDTVMKEEVLPKPENLRDDYEISNTNNVATVVKAEESYEVKNFGDLPLMKHQNSKLHDVSSYHVPHYTVTQPKPPGGPIKAPPIEPAPPRSAAQAQSDAHLRAVKIWTHRSKGVAYTLHKDGSLTLEKPKYG